STPSLTIPMSAAPLQHRLEMARPCKGSFTIRVHRALTNSNQPAFTNARGRMAKNTSLACVCRACNAD
ncbi:hypothetical protein, partial [Enterococcus faecium]|uniref:hypothetical protein n=1 Tax=Enterococcus faecium TaxID=1352 RepID=UPI003F43128B